MVDWRQRWHDFLFNWILSMSMCVEKYQDLKLDMASVRYLLDIKV